MQHRLIELVKLNKKGWSWPYNIEVIGVVFPKEEFDRKRSKLKTLPVWNCINYCNNSTEYTGFTIIIHDSYVA